MRTVSSVSAAQETAGAGASFPWLPVTRASPPSQVAAQASAYRGLAPFPAL